MRGRWALAAGAVAALVVVGGIGGLTMRAFAGVTRHTAKTTTVTRFCVYVDHTHPGSSNGDLNVHPKYGNKTCIAGKRGPAGDTSVITWNKTVASGAGIPPGAGRPGNQVGPNTVDLATLGPFTVRGECYGGEGAEAVTDVVSAQDGSFLAWNGLYFNGNFNSGDDDPVSKFASGVPGEPSFVDEGSSGDFSVSTADNTTAFTGFASNGAYMNGADGPACSFIGHLVIENAP